MSIIFYDCKTAPSPRRARILLAEKNVPHQVVEIDLRNEEQLGEEYKAINPLCTVPALRLDDGIILTENAGIAAYLEAEFPNPPLLGTNPVEKGLVANWNATIEFHGLWAVADALRNSASGLKNRATTGPVNYAQIPELAERGMDRLKRFFDMLDERLGGRDYVATDSFSLADITAVVAVDFARIVKVTAQDHQRNLIRWRESLSDRPSLSV